MTGSVWFPSRQAGLERMQAFIPWAGSHYARLRNFDFGPADRSNISLLSPWLRHGALREEEVLRAVLEQHTPGEAGAFIQEVFWRGYFRGWLDHHPGVWPAYVRVCRLLYERMQADTQLADQVGRACSGQTGIECFDSWTKELLETGWLHNHARMWFASIWIFTLGLPWQLGADFFLRHLLDGDPASNTCSWRWVAGLHTPGKTYLAREDNIALYTAGRFRPSGQLAGTAVPLTEPAMPAAPPARRSDRPWPADGYTLLVTEDDLLPETLALTTRPADILLLDGPVPRSGLALGNRATSFTRGLISDAAARISVHFGIRPALVPHEELSGKLVQAARCSSKACVVTARLRDGPVGDVVMSHWPAGLDRLEVGRSLDEAIHPHASAGFFRLRKRIDRILETALGDEPQDVRVS